MSHAEHQSPKFDGDNNELEKAGYGNLTGSDCLSVLAAGVEPSAAQAPPPSAPSALPSETPAKFEPVTHSFDSTRRDVMIPMRDGLRE